MVTPSAIQYEVVRVEEGRIHVREVVTDCTRLVLATIERTNESVVPFDAYVDHMLIGRYPTIIGALEGIVDYCQIIKRQTLVAADLFG